MRACAEAVDKVAEAAGTTANFRDSPLERRARDVRQAQSRFEKISAELTETGKALREARARQQRIEAGIEQLAARLTAARAAERTLRDSPEMRDAQALRQVEQAAQEKAADAAEAERRRDAAIRILKRRNQHLRERSQAFVQSGQTLRTAGARAARSCISR